MRATWMRDGAFSRRLMVGCEQSAPPLSGAFPDASLNRGSARSMSQSSASSHGTGFAGPRTGSTAGDRQHAQAEHGRERVNHLRLIAPIPDAACQGLGEVQTAFRLAQQDEAAVGRDQTAIEGSSIRITLGRAQPVGILARAGPISRCSRTVITGKTRRPSGTCLWRPSGPGPLGPARGAETGTLRRHDLRKLGRRCREPRCLSGRSPLVSGCHDRATGGWAGVRAGYPAPFPGRRAAAPP